MIHRLMRGMMIAGILLIPAISHAADKPKTAPKSNVTLASLLKEAKTKTSGPANVELAPPDSPLFADIELLETKESGRIPNYLRGVAAMSGSAKFMSHLIRTALYTGSLSPEIKMGMGLRIAEGDHSVYSAAYLSHLLGGTEKGRELLKHIDSKSAGSLTAAEAAALEFATHLGKGPTELTASDFEKVRGLFNDSEIVELTTTTCFFSYFTHLVEGMRVPIETWSLEPALLNPETTRWKEPTKARVALISDAEIAAVKTLGAPTAPPTGGPSGAPPSTSPAGQSTTPPSSEGRRNPPSSSLGIGIANSQRAMARNPEMQQAWFSSMRSGGSNVVDRAHKLQVSFAVSMVNGCRYCTLHQVMGLRRLGIDPAKLIAMQKDDSALTPSEKTAVDFARKLTRTPSEVNREDYQKLIATFGDKGAYEVLLQTCTFNFMNRFTDGLGLPSEDEAIKTYLEVYGQGAYQNYHAERAKTQYGK